MSDPVAMSRLMAEMKAMKSAASQQVLPNPYSENKTNAPDFTTMLKGAIDSVNDTSMQSGELKRAFEKGDPNVSLAQVMIASQKSSIAMNAVTQVRNKLVEAYKDVMNMPV